MFSQSILAAWSLEPSYYLRAEHNDNIYLATPGNELAVSGGAFSPAIKAIMEKENQYFVADVNMQFTRYKDHKELDTDEGKADINWSQSTELSLYGVNAGYAKQSNLNTTIETSGIDEKVIQRTAKISPNWKYQLDERWNISANFSYTDTEYDEPGISGYTIFKVVNFINYVEQSVNFTVSNELTERDSLSLTYYKSVYEGEGNGYQINGIICEDLYTCFVLNGFDPSITRVAQASERKMDYDYTVLQLGYEHRFNEASSLSLQAGSSDTSIHNQVLAHLFDQNFDEILPLGNWIVSDTSQTGQVYNLSFKKSSEISRIEFSVGRNRVAAATGGLDETDTAKIYYRANLTERLSWSANVNRANHRPDKNTNVLLVADYALTSVSPSLNYIISKDWSATLGYRYSQVDRDINLQPRESNVIFFTMSWREPKLLSTN